MQHNPEDIDICKDVRKNPQGKIINGMTGVIFGHLNLEVFNPGKRLVQLMLELIYLALQSHHFMIILV